MSHRMLAVLIIFLSCTPAPFIKQVYDNDRIDTEIYRLIRIDTTADTWTGDRRIIRTYERKDIP